MGKSLGMNGCSYCVADADGRYNIFSFDDPLDSHQSALVSFYGGALVVEVNLRNDEWPYRLEHEIKFCPMCGKKLIARR